MTRCRPAPLPCGAIAGDPDTVERPMLPGDAPGGPSSCAQSRSAAAPAAAPEASARLAQVCLTSRPYREDQKKCDEGGKDQAEIPADGQKLQAIEFIGREANHACYRLIHSLPDQIVQFDSQARRPDISGGRHLDMIAGVEHERAENAADWLSEACPRILSRGGRIGKAAAPGRCAS